MAGLLFGIDKPDSGTLTVDGRVVERHSPLASIARGVALSPEDRKAEGIVDDLTVRENIVLALQAGRGWFRSPGPAPSSTASPTSTSACSGSPRRRPTSRSGP